MKKISLRNSVSSSHLKEMLYIHPALSEAILPAAVEAVGEIEKYNKNKE